jgi:hypothetical protein
MTKVISDTKDVPHGYVRLSEITKDVTDAKRLSDAHDQGDIPAVKLIRTTGEIKTGPVWVCERSARDFLAGIHAARSRKNQPAKSTVTDGVGDLLCDAETFHLFLRSIGGGVVRAAQAAEGIERQLGSIASSLAILAEHAGRTELAGICVEEAETTDWNERSST